MVILFVLHTLLYYLDFFNKSISLWFNWSSFTSQLYDTFICLSYLSIVNC